MTLPPASRPGDAGRLIRARLGNCRNAVLLAAFDSMRPALTPTIAACQTASGTPATPHVKLASLYLQASHGYTVSMASDLLSRITIEPGKCGGRPCIRGYRMRVSDVLDLLAAGASFEEVLRDYDLL